MGHRLALLGGTTDRHDVGLALQGIVSASGRIRGADIRRFEEAFAEHVGVRHCISLATGRLGLLAALEGLGIGAGHEVLVPLPTHVVVANAVRAAGATPVFVDCRPDTANIDLDAAAGLVTSRTRAVLLQHTFGIPADVDAAVALAARFGLALIEDCVHALGATWRGAPVGGFGAAAFFSTEETKVISTTLGGAVVTDDDVLADAMRRFVEACAWPSDRLVQRRMAKLVAYHLLTWPPVHRAARAAYERFGRRHPLPLPVSTTESAGGFPPENHQRISNAQARIGVRQLQGLERNLAHRRGIAAVYLEELGAAGTMAVPAPAEPCWVRFPLLVDDRGEAARAAAPHTVLGTWFTSVLEESDSPSVAGYVAGSCPVAEQLCRHLVNLPTHQRVTPMDARAIARAVRAHRIPVEAVCAGT